MDILASLPDALKANEDQTLRIGVSLYGDFRNRRRTRLDHPLRFRSPIPLGSTRRHGNFAKLAKQKPYRRRTEVPFRAVFAAILRSVRSSNWKAPWQRYLVHTGDLTAGSSRPQGYSMPCPNTASPICLSRSYPPRTRRMDTGSSTKPKPSCSVIGRQSHSPTSSPRSVSSITPARTGHRHEARPALSYGMISYRLNLRHNSGSFSVGRPPWRATNLGTYIPD